MLCSTWTFLSVGYTQAREALAHWSHGVLPEHLMRRPLQLLQLWLTHDVRVVHQTQFCAYDEYTMDADGSWEVCGSRTEAIEQEHTVEIKKVDGHLRGPDTFSHFILDVDTPGVHAQARARLVRILGRSRCGHDDGRRSSSERHDPTARVYASTCTQRPTRSHPSVGSPFALGG